MLTDGAHRNSTKHSRPMKAPLLLGTCLFATLARAEYLLDFSDPGGGNPGTIAPFIQGANATVCQWSALHGGSMEVAFAGGWAPRVAEIDLKADAAANAEYELALANGGTLSFTVIVQSADILGTAEPFKTAPGWFEMIYIGNSDGVYDQQFGGADGLVGLYGAGGFPQGEVRTFDVSYPILKDTAATRDKNAQFNQSSGYSQIFLGMNSGGGVHPTDAALSYSGGRYFLDNFRIKANETEAPVVIPDTDITAAGKGMHLLNAGASQWDRQGLKTTGENYSWVGQTTNGPVDYKFTIRSMPDAQDLNALIYMAPGTGLTTNAPDWSQPVCIQVAIIANSSGGAWARISYKDHTADSNGVPGHEYWMADDGTGQGGMLADASSSKIEGTWTVRFTSDTEVTLISPDGNMDTGTMLQTTADKFANPLSVWFSTLPTTVANIGSDTIIDSIAITGLAEPLNADLSTGVLPDSLVRSAAVNAGVFGVTGPAWWVQWSLPAPGFALAQSAVPGDVDHPWLPASEIATTLDLQGGSIRRALYMPAAAGPKMFFRLEKP